MLEPGSRVTLYSGARSDGGTALYWHSDGAVWNDGGDTVVIATADGEDCSRELMGE